MTEDRDHFKVGNPNQYRRHSSIRSLKGLKDKKLRSKISQQQKIFHTASERLASSEILLPEAPGFLETEGLEKSYSITQDELSNNISIGAINKRFSLDLSYGPYSVNYSKNGNHLLMGGRKGYISMLDISNGTPSIALELPLEKEQINDVHFLHDHTLFAVAQRKYIYIYDAEGIEIHCIRDHVMSPYKLDFLPYHFLLCSIGEFGELKYQDVSTGQVSAVHRTGRGPCHIMKHNGSNGVIHLGHNDGVVSLWTPNVSTPVMEVFAQKGGVSSLDIANNYLVTAGNDNSWKVWDIRKYSEYTPLHNYNSFGSSVRSISISGTGLVGVGFGGHIQIWKDIFLKSKQKMPYITHNHPGVRTWSVEFQPWNDVLCIGHTHGVETIIVPGAGYANFDSRECNIFETSKQRKNREVRMLLEKLPASTITLYPDIIGRINKAPRVVETPQENENKLTNSKKRKNKKRGRSKITNVLKNKQIAYTNMIRNKAKQIASRKGKEKTNSKSGETISSKGKSQDLEKISTRNALDRFKSF
ncbi:BING4CT (NUC141) domain-containing protein [Cryptosporidium felis]|nr:BING4CT (NUC141) domain-containing protein [Cryptosporidium felis]